MSSSLARRALFDVVVSFLLLRTWYHCSTHNNNRCEILRLSDTTTAHPRDVKTSRLIHCLRTRCCDNTEGDGDDDDDDDNIDDNNNNNNNNNNNSNNGEKG